MKKTIIHLTGVGLIRQKRWLLKNIHWSVEEGQCCAIIGPNGAGKSTLAALLCGYFWPTRGTVEILGKTFGSADLAEIRKITGLVAPSRMPAFPIGLTVSEIVATGFTGTLIPPASQHRKNTREKKRIRQELQSLDLLDRMQERFECLSTGEKIRVLLARAMAADPALLILDEPAAGLDMAARAALLRTLEKRLAQPCSPTLIVVSHHLEELPAPLHQALLLHRGQILASGPARQVLTTENISKAYGCRIRVRLESGRYLAKIDSDEWNL